LGIFWEGRNTYAHRVAGDGWGGLT
jgi:hypothetical protein